MREDSAVTFSPGNYDTTTTPEAEWRVVTDPEEGTRVSVGARRVQTLAALRENPMVEEAGLRDEEILALELYTGCSLTVSLSDCWREDRLRTGGPGPGCRDRDGDFLTHSCVERCTFVSGHDALRRSDVLQVQRGAPGLPAGGGGRPQGQQLRHDIARDRERRDQAFAVRDPVRNSPAACDTGS